MQKEILCMPSYTHGITAALMLSCALTTSFAASPAIGLAISPGSIQVDHSSIRGNATLFDGNLIETSASASSLKLHGGIHMLLAAESRARVYESRLILEKGAGQLDSGHYEIEAAGLRIAPDKSGALAKVQLAGPNRVIVGAEEGTVRVSNHEGVLVARLALGREMVFEPQASGAATKVSGILAVKDGKFIVVDRVTNVTMELQGQNLEAQVGNLVEITGTVSAAAPTVAGASQVIDVTGIKRLVKGERAAAAGAAGAAGGAGAAGAAAGGISTGATVAIIGGVAAAGTVGGLAAAHALPGQGDNQPSTSR